MAKAPPDAVMTIGELSKYPKISRSTLYKLAQEGKLPAQKGRKALAVPQGGH